MDQNRAALEALERRLADMERKGNALVEVINDLRAEMGMPAHPPLGTGGHKVSSASSTGSAQIGSIRSDTFYGKKMQTAVREYLEMRRGANLGPAAPREIYDAVVSGGFKSEAKDDAIALVGLRAMLRKRTNYFHKLPNGSYGLTAWYPDAKQTKSDDDEVDVQVNGSGASELDAETGAGSDVDSDTAVA